MTPQDTIATTSTGNRPFSAAVVLAVSMAINLVGIGAPALLWAASMRADLDHVRDGGSVALRQHIDQAGGRDNKQDERLQGLEKAVELRGAQLDRIESDVKELLRRIR